MPEMPEDATELFDKMLPASLARHPDAAREVNVIYTFKISGEGGGDWTCDLTADPPTCLRGDTGKAQCTLAIDHDDFKTMLGDPNAGMQLYFQGKFRLSGDPDLAMKMQDVFRLALGD